MEYRIVTGFDPNTVPSANLVVVVNGGSISYNAKPGVGKTQTLTIAYYDDESGSWLVGAEPDVMATLPTPQYELDAVVAADKGAWGTFRYSHSNDSQGHGHGKGWQLGGVPPGVWVSLGVSAPLPAQYLPFDIDGDCVGLKPEPPWSCGPFRAEETSSVWYGDDLGIELLSMAAVGVVDDKRIG